MMKRFPFVLLCLCALHLSVAAHVLDEYLQAAQIALAPDGVRVELRLIPGVKVADRIFPLIDLDGDGQISPAEEQSYARLVIQDIALKVDGQRNPLVLESVQFPLRQEIIEGMGAICLDLAADTAFEAGDHQLSFRNDHLPEIGVYLANILISRNAAIEIGEQQRDELQHELKVGFCVLPAVAAPPSSHRTSALLFAICLLLLVTQRERLRHFFQNK